MNVQPAKRRILGAIKVRLDQIPRILPHLTIRATRAVRPQWLQRPVPLSNRLHTKVLPPRRLHSFHVLILGTENHAGTQEIHLERLASLAGEELLLVLEESVLFEIGKCFENVVEAEKGIAMRVFFEGTASSAVSSTFILYAFDYAP